MRREIEAVLGALNRREVRYLLVGGLAVVLHGHLRTTKDLDLVVQLDPENVERALDSLEDLGYRPMLPVSMSDFADPAVRDQWHRERNMVAFSVWRPENPLFQVDLFVAEPFGFGEIMSRKLEARLGTLEVPIPAVEDLIRLKEASGRPQDLADVAALRQLERDRRSAGGS